MNSRASRPETIVCAAVLASNGKVVVGRDHNDAIRTLQMMDGYESKQPRGQRHGFITSADRYVNRREAYRLHFPDRAEQGELYSDDL